MDQSTPAGNPLLLPILKFSYATSSAERNSPLGWTHLSGGADLVVIFGHATTTDQRTGETQHTRSLKVQRGSEVLEELNLGSLAQQAARGLSDLQSQDPKSSIAVLVKSPCLAIRYPVQVNQVRRFQVKFTSDADYYKAISILNEVGCPITESSAGSGSASVSGHPPATSHHGKAESLSGSRLMSGTASPPPASKGITTSTSCPAPSYPDVPTIRPSSAVQVPRASSIGSSSTVSAVPQTQANHRMQSVSASVFRNQDFQQQSCDHNSDRPYTAPTASNLNCLNEILPPKRELPFAKPGSTKKPRRENNNHNNSLDSRQQQLQLSPTGTVSTSAAKLAPTSGPQNTNHSRAQTMTSPSPAHLNRRQDNSTPGSGTGIYTGQKQSTLAAFQKHLATQQQQPPPQNPLPVEAATPRAPLTTSSPAFINQLNSPSQHPPGPSTTTSTSIPPSTTTAPTQPHEQEKPQPDPGDLSSYLSTPAPERTAQLEAWMCAQLESDGFLALCRDVEGAWRRIAYGF